MGLKLLLRMKPKNILLEPANAGQSLEILMFVKLIAWMPSYESTRVRTTVFQDISTDMRHSTCQVSIQFDLISNCQVA